MGEIKLLDRKVIQEGSGTRKDHIEEFTFLNTFPLYRELVQAVQELTGYETVEKGAEEWLECTHEMIEVTADTVTMRFTKPYAG